MGSMKDLHNRLRVGRLENGFLIFLWLDFCSNHGTNCIYETENVTMSSLEAQFCTALETMTKSIADTRATVRKLQEKKGSDDLEMADGISLLSLKHQVMLTYLHGLALLSAHRVLGHSLTERNPPAAPFSDPARQSRGSAPGDIVDMLMEGRLVLEKTKTLEARMKYQIDKLVRAAQQTSTTQDIQDPLSFRPNPENFVQAEEKVESDGELSEGDGVYRPPRVAPMPYNEADDSKKTKRSRAPAALTALEYQNPNDPYMESTSGLGGAGKGAMAATSARARELARMTEYEESHMTRLVMSKKEAKRRRQDEENLALGGSALGTQYGRGRARGAGFADEFGDLLRAREGKNNLRDDYEELRARSKKKTAFERSKAREIPDNIQMDGDERPRKRTKFHQELKKAKRADRQRR